MQAFRPATILKRDSNTGVSCGYCELCKISFFIENFRWLLLTVTTVEWSQLGCFLFDFAPSRAFELDQKLTQNFAQIILLLSRGKTIYFLLELIYHVLSISEYVLEKHLISILIKNLHKALYKKQCYITSQQTFFACTLWLINLRALLGDGRMQCKQKMFN